MVRNLCIGKTWPPLVTRYWWRRPGLTGWSQINGRSGVRTTLALRLDLSYIENWSLSLDLYILTKTFGAVIRGKSAY
jgi:lipopolysaccharide/colanic/teichoic acid biosynthesis glycosyltransferase